MSSHFNPDEFICAVKKMDSADKDGELVLGLATLGALSRGGEVSLKSYIEGLIRESEYVGEERRKSAA